MRTVRLVIAVLLYLISWAVVLITCNGCATAPAHTIPAPATAAGAALVKLINQDWLVLLGSMLCMTGVFVTINSGTKGIAIIGAGLAGLAIAGIWAAFVSALADYRGWMLIGLGLLVAIGIGAFFITAADINGDGKVSWADVKDLMRKR